MRSKKKLIAAATFGVLCGYDVANCLCFRRCCGGGHKHLGCSEIAGRFSRKQCGVSRNRRDTCGSAVCEDNTRIPRLSQTRSA